MALFLLFGRRELSKETNFSSYIAVGMWHHYLNFLDKDFLEDFWPTLDKAIEFTLSGQTEHGDFFGLKTQQIGWMIL